MSSCKFLLIFLFVHITCSTVYGQGRFDVLLAKADSLSWENEFDASIEIYNQILGQALREGDLDAYKTCLLGLGIANRYREDNNNDFHKAIDYFTEAFLVVKNSELENDKLLSEMAYHISTTYRRLFSYQKAQEFAELAIAINEQSDNMQFKAKAHQSLGNILSQQKNFEEAEKALNVAIACRESLKLEKDPLLYNYYWNKALHMRAAQKYEESSELFKQTMSSMKHHEIEDQNASILSIALIAENHCKSGDHIKAQFYYDQLKRLNSQSFSKDVLREFYGRMGELNKCFGKMDSASYFYLNELELEDSLIYYLEHLVLERDVNGDFIVNEDKDYFDLDKIAKAFEYRYDLNNQVENLKKARAIYKLINKIIFKLRVESHENEQSQHLAEHSTEIYEHALHNAFQLYKIDKDQSLLNDALLYMESNKQLILWKQKIVNGINNDSYEDARNLDLVQYGIDSLRLSMTNLDSSTTKDFRIQLMKEITTIHALSRNNESQEEVELRLDEKFIQLKELRNFLKPKQGIMSYFWGVDHLYILFVEKGSSSFHRIARSPLDSVITSFLNACNQPNKFNLEENFDSFVSQSIELYEYLIGHIIKDENARLPEELIIVPDGRIGEVSFLALILDNSNADLMNYAELNYLIRNSDLFYAFSISNLFEDSKKTKSGNSLGAFSNKSLVGSELEIEKIQSLWNGKAKLFQGNLSSENNLKSVVNDFDILHVATHAHAGINEQSTYLSFEDNVEKSSDDERLYNFEIYPMNINARLVTLSGCETGKGRGHSGEGVYSLARGFNYAGCPTVVMSLWKISDMQTSRLMPNFYSFLQQEKSISNAMRRAQLNYLNSVTYEDGHPYYWAGLVVIGDGMQVFDRTLYLKNILLILFFGLIIFFAIQQLIK